MQDTQLSQISNFIWGVADDLLRDVYVRGKYRDVILPMTVLRRLDAVLEPTKQKVLDEKKWADDEGIENQAPILEDAADQSFYNTSPFGLKDLTSRASQQQLRDDFNAYLGRVLSQRPGHPGEVRIPQPVGPTLHRGRTRQRRHAVPIPTDQPQPGTGPQPGRLSPAPRPGQPRHRHDLRGPGAPLQRGE